MADLHVPQARHTVHDAVAIAIGQPHAFALDDDARAFLAQRAMIGERVQMVAGIQCLERIGWILLESSFITRSTKDVRAPKGRSRA
jgi:hypothetical protein